MCLLHPPRLQRTPAHHTTGAVVTRLSASRPSTKASGLFRELVAPTTTKELRVGSGSRLGDGRRVGVGREHEVEVVSAEGQDHRHHALADVLQHAAGRPRVEKAV